MVNTDKVIGAMRAAGYTVKQGAKAIGMPASTMYAKLREGVFNSDEICLMIEAFNIEDVVGTFFEQKKRRGL